MHFNQLFSPFHIKTTDEFNANALNLFSFQAKNVPIYSAYIRSIGADIKKITHYSDIPFLPISFFKTHKVCVEQQGVEKTFKSSGTTGTARSKHHVADLHLYEQSFIAGFKQFYGNPEDYCIIAVLPNYISQGDSSLIYMVNRLIAISNNPFSGFYQPNEQQLTNALKSNEEQGKKTLLIGVTYALLQMIEQNQFQLSNTIVMETGGMKGKGKELVKEDLYALLKNGFGVQEIHSEYGMTELLSQAYSTTNAQYKTPPWMKVLLREVNDPLSLQTSKTSGGINIIDLANIYSCAFIATEDLGRVNENGSFQIIGRLTNSDIRGCNQLVF